jgi:hypothetical protein
MVVMATPCPTAYQGPVGNFCKQWRMNLCWCALQVETPPPLEPTTCGLDSVPDFNSIHQQFLRQVYSICAEVSVSKPQAFSTSMSVEELCTWLLSNNVLEEDCAVFRRKCFGNSQLVGGTLYYAPCILYCAPCTVHLVLCTLCCICLTIW